MSDKPPPPVVEAETFESTPSTSDPTFKFYQIAVPSFSFNQTGDDTGVTRTVANVGGDPTSGSSFLRLGAFPDITQAAKGPMGFVTSLGLANFIGASGQVPATKDDSPLNFSKDPMFLVQGFAHDSRVQGTKLQENQGFAETNVLLTKGGWWDHSDGNRISTTAGDKIEIIQGHYKMLVLGRQTDPTLGVIRDLSGGMNQENNQTPSNCVRSIEYTHDYAGEWSIYELNGIGNVYSAFYGNVGEVYFGKLKESWTGLAPGGFTSDFYAGSLARDKESNNPGIIGNEDPIINEYTFATSITSWTGAYNKPVASIDEHTFASLMTSETGSAKTRIGLIVESTYADSTTSTTDVLGSVTETTTIGSSSSTTTVRETVTETTTVGGAATETTTVGGAKSSTTTAGLITEVTMSGAHTAIELVGAKTNVFVGGLDVDLYVAALKFELSTGFNVEINATQKFVCTLFDTVDFGPERNTISMSDFKSSVLHEHASENHTLVGLVVNLGTAVAAIPGAIGAMMEDDE